MLVSRCPSCNESITVPDAPRVSRVRCPLCQDEYLLSDVLDKSPPMLELLDAPAGSVAFSATEAETRGVPAAFAFDEAPAPAAEPAAFDFDAGSAPATASRPVTKAPRRARRKQRNPLVEVAKIVGGGVAGLFIAQMLLWWLPLDLQSSQRDPVQLGRNLSPYVPWIMPAEVRGEQPPSGEQSPENSTDNTSPKNDNSPFAPKNIERDRQQRNGGSLPQQDSQTTDDGLTGANGGAPSATSSTDASASSGSPLVEPSPATRTSPDVLPNIAKSSKPGFKVPDNRSIEDLRSAIAKAGAANAAYDAAGQSQKAELAHAMYLAMAELSEVFTFLDQSKIESLVQPLKSLNELLGGLDARKYDGFASLAADWHQSNERSSNGIVLVGKIQQKVDIGDSGYYESSIELGDTGKTVSVVGWIGPSNRFRVGARVLILGAILDDPAAHLNNFPGSAPQTICGSYSLILENAP